MANADSPDHRRTTLLIALIVGIAGCGDDGGALGGVAEESVCATRSTLRGVDVSSYQGIIDWNTVRASGISFAFAKASEGTSLVDNTFARNWAGMRAAGVVRGAYHFFHPNESVPTQVALVLSTVGRLEVRDLPIVLDFESLDGVSEATAVSRAVSFLQAVANRTGRTPILYVSAGFLGHAYPALSPFPLWVAHYGVSCPRVPIGRSTWTFWQNSETGRVNGIPGGSVDADEFNGSLSDLSALFGEDTSGGGTPTGPADAGTPDASGDAIDAGPVDSGGGAADAGAADAGSPGAPAPPACALAGRRYEQNTCTETLQCDNGSWVPRTSDPMNCIPDVEPDAACITDRGAIVPMNTCTSTLQCNVGVWVSRARDLMRCL